RRIQARGVSYYLQDFDATFLSTLDRSKVVDPMAVQVVSDTSPHYRKSRIWVESTLRNTPIPLDQPELEVADRMLMDPLDYQKAAVHKTLGDLTIRPRILLADAVGLGQTLAIAMILSELARRCWGSGSWTCGPVRPCPSPTSSLWRVRGGARRCRPSPTRWRRSSTRSCTCTASRPGGTARCCWSSPGTRWGSPRSTTPPTLGPR